MGRYKVEIFAEKVGGGSPIKLTETQVDSLPIEKTLNIRYNLDKGEYLIYAKVKDTETGIETESNKIKITIYEMTIDTSIDKTKINEGETTNLTIKIKRV